MALSGGPRFRFLEDFIRRQQQPNEVLLVYAKFCNFRETSGVLSIRSRDPGVQGKEAVVDPFLTRSSRLCSDPYSRWGSSCAPGSPGTHPRRAL